MINYIEHDKGIELISSLLLQERIIPIFGAGFTKDSSSYGSTVPDGKQCTELMKQLILKYVPNIDSTTLTSYNFNDTAKRLRKSVPRSIPEREYVNFFKTHFTNVTLSSVKINFLKLPWPFCFTINIDDGIENTQIFNPILPYHNARRNYPNTKSSLFKLHGDANYEIKYTAENNIIFDSDQYTQSLNNPANQTMRESFTTAYKEFNLLFIGCSLENEPDIKYIYNSISKERHSTMGIVLKTNRLSSFEEDDLEDYGINTIILVNDYDVFYIDLFNAVSKIQTEQKSNNYPFTNPFIKVVNDSDLKFFSGYRCFDDHRNTFFKSDLIIDRDCLLSIESSLNKFNIIFLEGRRFSGKTSLLCCLCEKEKRRTIYFFPSTTQESPDVVLSILNSNTNSLLIFDSNSLSSECYFMIQDFSDILTTNNNKIIIAINQSDNYLADIVHSDYIKIKNIFSTEELDKLSPQTNLHALADRKPYNTNLDYLNILKREQGISLSLNLNLPKKYTTSEYILLLLLCVKDKVYSRDITSLGITHSDIKSFIKRVVILAEWIPTTRGEKTTYSAYKLVHNSKNIILEEVRKLSNDDIISSITKIVTTFKHGDSNQKRIYREVMQFDTLNQLFGRKKGAGKLIFKVYENLETLLSDDLHFWLQRSKSIYRLVPNKYWKLRSSYSFAKKVYLDSNNPTLTTKAALSISLINSLLFNLERKPSVKVDLVEESINLGYEAIFSDYYTQEKKLQNDLNIESESKNYADLIQNICSIYINSQNIKHDVSKKAINILNKLK